MTGLVRKASLMTVCGLLAASAAMAGIPSAVNSDIPCGFPLIGETGGVADEKGEFTITFRDLAGNRLPFPSVLIDFTDCCQGIRFSENQLYGSVDPNFVRVGRTFRTRGDALGVARFRIMGAATASDPTLAAGCAKVYADGVLMTDGISHPLCQVSAFDLNGAGGGSGMDPGDLSIWLADFFASPTPYRARSDYDYPVSCVQDIGPSDLSQWLAVFFGSGSVSNGPTYVACP